jgi:hypothetical protein
MSCIVDYAQMAFKRAQVAFKAASRKLGQKTSGSLLVDASFQEAVLEAADQRLSNTLAV